MAMFAGILDKIRTKKKELALSSSGAYLEMLREAAKGAELDSENVSEILDAAKKTEADFERDFPVMERRIELAELLAERNKLDAVIPKMRQKFENAQNELNEAVRRLQPAIDASYAAMQAAEQQRLSMSYIDGKLAATCLDECLLARENELVAKRKELFEKRRPLGDDLQKTQTEVSNAKAMVETLERRLEKSMPYDRITIEPQLQQYTRTLKYKTSILTQLSEAVGKLDAEITPITKDLADIQRQKLQP
jgi:hypothetical protein